MCSALTDKPLYLFNSGPQFVQCKDSMTDMIGQKPIILNVILLHGVFR